MSENNKSHELELVVALTGMAKMYPEGVSFQAFVLQLGFSMTPPTLPLPAGMPKGTVKECYTNCFNWKYKNQENPLTYCEGYAIGRLGLPVLHAWLVYPDGKVVDPTWCGESDYDDAEPKWTPTPGKAYLGIPFDFDYVMKTARKSKHYGVIDNHTNHFSLVERWHAAWKDGKSFTEGLEATWQARSDAVLGEANG